MCALSLRASHAARHVQARRLLPSLRVSQGPRDPVRSRAPWPVIAMRPQPTKQSLRRALEIASRCGARNDRRNVLSRRHAPKGTTSDENAHKGLGYGAWELSQIRGRLWPPPHSDSRKAGGANLTQACHLSIIPPFSTRAVSPAAVAGRPDKRRGVRRGPDGGSRRRVVGDWSTLTPAQVAGASVPGGRSRHLT